MKEYRDREIGDIERRQLIHPRTSSPIHKEYDSMEVHDGTHDALDAQEDHDSMEAQDETQAAQDDDTHNALEDHDSIEAQDETQAAQNAVEETYDVLPIEVDVEILNSDKD